ncbi:CidA/LrgA family protein [Paenibacillus timonensis]|uniref:CidA/LrgA family protein n=2 Tax=Paenibacillus TaxID=44249 RepID=A0A9X1XZX6_9BACL|nr:MULTISPECIES: CidA/LrgA family protein [Paenibacillus]MBW4838274.1 CidA/LrgA family protein [Paenibacillaceae bacterium]MCH1638998.1 CidA/LrgA family protein [Paenibacillus timonensis]MCK8488352.1 CidA/LrgA family protein [Paenibacillus mellifer]
MKVIKFFLQIALLTGFYGAGLLLQTVSKAPIPGSIFGLVLLFLALKLRIVPAKWMEQGAGFMQKFIPLFLVPATVGVMDYFQVFTAGGQWLILIVVLSTLLTMILAGLTTQWVAQRTPKPKEEAAPCVKSFTKQA